MTWSPTPPANIPTPDVILGHLEPGPGEGPTGYIAAADLSAIVSALLSIDYVIATSIGDPSLLVLGVPEHDLVHYLIGLEGRVAALEAAAGGTGDTPVAEGVLEVDNYAEGFIRLRDTGGVLDDGATHVMRVGLATVPGPGGELIVGEVPQSTSPVWFDHNGTLGNVIGTTGTSITQTVLQSWLRYSNPDAGPGTIYYVQWVRLDTTTDPTRPRLVIERVAALS